MHWSEINVTFRSNIAELKRNFESKYLLDYITVKFAHDSYPVSEVTNWSYLQGVSVLYEHYMISGDLNNAERMKQLALAVANSVKDESYKEYKQNVINYFSVERSE